MAQNNRQQASLVSGLAVVVVVANRRLSKAGSGQIRALDRLLDLKFCHCFPLLASVGSSGARLAGEGQSCTMRAEAARLPSPPTSSTLSIGCPEPAARASGHRLFSGSPATGAPGVSQDICARRRSPVAGRRSAVGQASRANRARPDMKSHAKRGIDICGRIGSTWPALGSRLSAAATAAIAVVVVVSRFAPIQSRIAKF